MKKNIPNCYPTPFKVMPGFESFKKEYANYKPVYYLATSVLKEYAKNGKLGYADREDFDFQSTAFKKIIEDNNILTDQSGFPLNPNGRTGIIGRGLLGRWGPNYSVDIITTARDENNNLLLRVITRKDNDQHALPGGMIDNGESPRKAAEREHKEETNIDFSLDDHQIVYKGYVNDPRNTDNAWITTTAFYKHLTHKEMLHYQQREKAGDDAKAIKWLKITDNFLNSLYASHGAIVKKILNKKEST